jgi:transcription elongation factor Elf1
MRRTTRQPIDKRAFTCPQCNKPRLIRPLDYTPSLEKQEYKTRDGSQIELFVDICEYCKTRNWQKHFEPTKADLKKVIKSIHQDKKISEEESLEDLL